MQGKIFVVIVWLALMLGAGIAPFLVTTAINLEQQHRDIGAEISVLIQNDKNWILKLPKNPQGKDASIQFPDSFRVEGDTKIQEEGVLPASFLNNVGRFTQQLIGSDVADCDHSLIGNTVIDLANSDERIAGDQFNTSRFILNKLPGSTTDLERPSTFKLSSFYAKNQTLHDSIVADWTELDDRFCQLTSVFQRYHSSNFADQNATDDGFNFYTTLSEAFGLRTVSLDEIFVYNVYMADEQNMISFPAKPKAYYEEILQQRDELIPPVAWWTRPWWLASTQGQYLGPRYQLPTSGLECFLSLPYIDAGRDAPVVRTLICPLGEDNPDAAEGEGRYAARLAMDLLWMNAAPEIQDLASDLGLGEESMREYLSKRFTAAFPRPAFSFEFILSAALSLFLMSWLFSKTYEKKALDTRITLEHQRNAHLGGSPVSISGQEEMTERQISERGRSLSFGLKRLGIGASASSSTNSQWVQAESEIISQDEELAPDLSKGIIGVEIWRVALSMVWSYRLFGIELARTAPVFVSSLIAAQFKNKSLPSLFPTPRQKESFQQLLGFLDKNLLQVAIASGISRAFSLDDWRRKIPSLSGDIQPFQRASFEARNLFDDGKSYLFRVENAFDIAASLSAGRHTDVVIDATQMLATVANEGTDKDDTIADWLRLGEAGRRLIIAENIEEIEALVSEVGAGRFASTRHDIRYLLLDAIEQQATIISNYSSFILIEPCVSIAIESIVIEEAVHSSAVEQQQFKGSKKLKARGVCSNRMLDYNYFQFFAGNIYDNAKSLKSLLAQKKAAATDDDGST